jgi:hypothetical protein
MSSNGINLLLLLLVFVSTSRSAKARRFGQGVNPDRRATSNKRFYDMLWSNSHFAVAVHENSHLAAATTFGAVGLFVKISARGGLAKWTWLETPTPKMLIVIAAAGFLGERELLGRFEPIDGTSDEEQIEKLRDCVTPEELEWCRNSAGVIVRNKRQWILASARTMSAPGTYWL